MNFIFLFHQFPQVESNKAWDKSTFSPNSLVTVQAT